MAERVLICGDRHWSDWQLIRERLSLIDAECVIEGEARGADSMGRDIALELHIPVKPFPADWDKYGRAAGPIRNQQMLTEGKPTLVLAFHNDIARSKGTADMVRRAKAAGITVEVLTNDGRL